MPFTAWLLLLPLFFATGLLVAVCTWGIILEVRRMKKHKISFWRVLFPKQ